MEKDRLTVHFCGLTACEPGAQFGPGMRPHYLLHLVLSGRGILQKGAGIYHLKQGDIFLTRPGEMVYYEADVYEPWSYVWTAFGGEEAKAHISRTVLETESTARLEERREEGYRETFCGMVREFQSQEFHPAELAGFLLALLGPLTRRENEAYESSKEEYLSRAKRYIEENYNYDVRVWDLSKYVGIDRSYLYRIFMEREHMSPKQYLTGCRIRAAKELLESGRYTVTETAYSSGFVDTESLEYHFRQCEGMTPGEYLYQARRKRRESERKEPEEP